MENGMTIQNSDSLLDQYSNTSSLGKRKKTQKKG